MKIKIRNYQRKITINKHKITNLAARVLRIKGVKKAELGIIFAGKTRISALNRKFRKVDQPTDVLAFSMREGKDAHLHPELLGDIVIYPEIAERRSKIYQTSQEYEILLYLVHGILHLLGCEDNSRRGYLSIKQEQEAILKRLDIHK